MTVQATFVATLVDEWARAGITDAVICAGSRSTPLTLALAAEQRFRLHVYLDERAAGYFALGLGLSRNRPALVVTTSGTAAAELLPAIVEAHHAGVPLLACTADRPAGLHGVRAPQTIEQEALYVGVLRWQWQAGPAEALGSPAWRSLAARAVAETMTATEGPGPVHVNLPFAEPLVAQPGPLPEGRPGGRPWHGVAGRNRGPSAGAVDQTAAMLSGRPGVVIAGAGVSDSGPVLGLAEQLGWPVLADPRSACRGRSTNAVVVSAFDPLLRDPQFAATGRPDVVLRLGSPPASKVLGQWLANLGIDQLITAPWGAWADPDRIANVVVPCDPALLCAAVLKERPPAAHGHWARTWRAAEAAAQQAIVSVLAAHDEPTEPGVARTLTATLASSVTLFVSSSMPIRDVEWFGDPTGQARVLANRGANGIDGIVSTALGTAAGGAGPGVALIGDLSLLYDSSSLVGASRRGINLTLVVIDNDGGGIFSFLPQADALSPERFEQLFGTPHGVDLCALAAAHGIPATVADRAADLGPAVGRAIAAGGVRMVVVPTQRPSNVAVHAELVDAVARALHSGSGSHDGGEEGLQL